MGAKDGKHQFWERASLTRYPISEKMIEQMPEYIHNNPVQGKCMLANDPLGYKYSSAGFYENGDNEFDFLSHYMGYLISWKLLVKTPSTGDHKKDKTNLASSVKPDWFLNLIKEIILFKKLLRP